MYNNCLASWRNGRRMGLKIPGHMTCEFKSRRGYFATLAERHTRQAQTLFFLSSTLRSSIALLSWRNSYERNVLTETNHKTRDPEITGCWYPTKYQSRIRKSER